MLVSDSATTKYAAASTAAGTAPRSPSRRSTGSRAASAQCGDRAGQTAVGEDRRVHGPQYAAQLVHGLLCAVTGVVEQLGGLLRVVCHGLLGDTDPHGQRDQLGLSAVVQVALDPAQLCAVRVHRTGPALGELLDPLRESGGLQLRCGRCKQAERRLACTAGQGRSDPAQEGQTDQHLQRAECQRLEPAVDVEAHQGEVARGELPQHHAESRRGHRDHGDDRDEQLGDHHQRHQQAAAGCA